MTKRKFEVGQSVRIIAPDSLLRGSVATIVAITTGELINDRDNSIYAIDDLFYETDIPDGRGRGFAYLARDLEPINDPFTAGSWSEIEKLTRWTPASSKEVL